MFKKLLLNWAHCLKNPWAFWTQTAVFAFLLILQISFVSDTYFLLTAVVAAMALVLVVLTSAAIAHIIFYLVTETDPLDPEQ